MTELNVLALNNQAHIRTPEDLLAELLPQFVEAVDTVRDASVYHLSRGGLVLWHTTKNSEQIGTFYSLEADSIFQAALEQDQAVIDEEQHIVVTPMIANGETFALLHVEYDGSINLELVQEFANDLGLVLHDRNLHRLVQKQMSAMALMHEAKSLTDVAAIVAQTMAESQQYIGMNVFEFDAQGKVQAARIITTANRRETFAANMVMPINQSAIQSIYELLEAEGDILISDVANDARFSMEGQQWLLQQKAKSTYLIAMPIQGRLFAFISLIDTKQAMAPTQLEALLFKNVAYQAAAVIEKQELLEQTRQSADEADEQVRVMRLLHDLVQQINQEQDETRILNETSETLLKATHADHIGIILMQDNRGYVVSEAPKQGIVGLEVEAGAGSVSEIMKKQRKPLVINDVSNDTVLLQKTRAALQQVGAESVVLIPMFDLNNRLLGSVGLDYYTKQDPISPVVIETAQMIVSQVVSNIHRVRLLLQSQQQAKQLQHITDFGQKLRAYLGIEEIVRTALQASRDLLELDYLAIMTYERQSDHLRYVGEIHYDETWVSIHGKFVDVEADMIAAQAWSKREMMYIDDLHADWEWKHPYEQDLQTVIAQPLASAGVVLGVMEIGHRNPSAYNAVDITTFQQMSNQLAIALSNAEAYAQSQKLARNKTLANDIITKIQQQADVRAILEVTVKELGQALRAKRGRIRLGSASPQSSGDQ